MDQPLSPPASSLLPCRDLRFLTSTCLPSAGFSSAQTRTQELSIHTENSISLPQPGGLCSGAEGSITRVPCPWAILLLVDPPLCLGHTAWGTLRVKLLVIYLKLKFNWHPGFCLLHVTIPPGMTWVCPSEVPLQCQLPLDMYFGP